MTDVLFARAAHYRHPLPPISLTGASARRAGAGTMDDAATSYLLVFTASFLANAAIRLVGDACLPSLVGRARWNALTPSQKYALALTPNSMFNSLLAPALVFPALTRTPPLTKRGKFAVITPSVDGDSSNACAVAIGFMAYDLVSMLWNYEASVRSNGKGLFHLYVWHHVLSILFWPVAILNRAFVYFVNWFILSEHSSFWLSLRGSMLTLGTINTPAGLFVQLAFVVSFFGARVAVMPDLYRSYVNADWAAVPGWQATIAAWTVPIPSMLNAYWGFLIVKSLAKVALGGGGKKKKKTTGAGPETRARGTAAPMGSPKQE